METRRSAPDAVTVLTAYLLTLFLVPASTVVSALGQVGGPATIVAFLCFLWWSWHRVNRGSHWSPGAQPVRNAGLVFLLTVALAYVHSAAIALPPAERSPADAAMIRMVGAVGLICVLAEGVDSVDRLWALARRWTLVLGFLTLLSAVQILTGQVWVDRLQIPGLSPAQGLELIQRGQITRPSATATHPIEFAAVLAMCMPLVFAVAAREVHRRVLMWLIALGVPVVLLLTGSRTALVCGALGFAVMAVAWSRPVRRVAGALAVLLLVIVFVTMPGMIGSLRGLFVSVDQDPSVQSRTASYRIVLAYWERHRWLGRGVGTFLPDYWILDNQYLGLLLGGGLIAVAGLVWLLVVALRSGWRAHRLVADSHDKQLAMAATAGVASGICALAFFDMFAFPQATGTLFLMVGMCGAVYRLAVDERVGSAESTRGDWRSPRQSSDMVGSAASP